ncbi:hypothetical protein FQV30_09720 [Planomicrobium sp. CPCC 101110]|nr:hypothetical protein FQV30_09720 [Planomicrobium sp. CPCC 101110]
MLQYYTKRFEVIIRGKYPANRKKLMIANLMSEMETAFNMPMQSNPEWEQENEEIIALYRRISASRNL